MRSIRKNTVLPSQQSAGLGVRQIFDIPLTCDLERLQITLAGSVTLSAVAAALKLDGICQLIESVELIGNGSTTICNIPFHQLVQGNLFRREFIKEATLTQPGLTVAAHPFYATAILDLSAVGALRPKDSTLRETKYKTLQLALRFADSFIGSVFTTGTVSASTISTRVKADETIEMADSGNQISSPILIPQYSYRELTVSGAADKERFRLTPDQALRGLTMRAVDSTGNVKSDAVLSRVRLYTGTTLRCELTAQAIRDDNIACMQAAVPTGYYYLSFARQPGVPDRMNDAYDLRQAVLGGADAYMEFDTSAALTLGVTQWGYRFMTQNGI